MWTKAQFRLKENVTRCFDSCDSNDVQVVLFGVYEVVRNGQSSGCDFEGLNYIVNATSSNL